MKKLKLSRFPRLLILIALSSFSVYIYGAPQQVKTIVIDAGHGGKDPGCLGKFTQEKDITLSIALKLGKMIEENFKDVKVIYTRDKDISLDTWRRPKIANKHKADLFLSIHCNSNELPKGAKVFPKGAETFVMGLHTSAENLAVAQKENQSILYEKDYMETYDGFDPSSPEAYIIFSLFQNAYLDQSLSFASAIQKQYQSQFKPVDRGVKQAGFLVLHGTTMPSVLTEMGFLNNPEEEKFMASEEGQEKIVLSLFEAFREYKYQVEGFNNQLEAKAKEVSPNVDTTKSVFAETSVDSTKSATSESIPVQKAMPKIVYKVQFASSATSKDLNSPEFKDIEKPGKYFHQGSYKYTSGESKTMEEAGTVLRKVQDLGFKDAFIVVFKDEERITTSEALRILQNNQ